MLGVAGGRETGLAGADDGKGFVGGEMGESFLEGAGEMELWSFGGDAEDVFTETEDAVGGGLQGLRGGIGGGAGDDDLDWVMRE